MASTHRSATSRRSPCPRLSPPSSRRASMLWTVPTDPSFMPRPSLASRSRRPRWPKSPVCRGTDLEPRLKTLVRREILTRDSDQRSAEQGQYAFVQALIREVAYNTLSKKDRKVRHLAAARYFEQLGSDELASALAGHYLAAHANASEGGEADALAGTGTRRIACRRGPRRVTWRTRPGDQLPEPGARGNYRADRPGGSARAGRAIGQDRHAITTLPLISPSAPARCARLLDDRIGRARATVLQGDILAELASRRRGTRLAGGRRGGVRGPLATRGARRTQGDRVAHAGRVRRARAEPSNCAIQALDFAEHGSDAEASRARAHGQGRRDGQPRPAARGDRFDRGRGEARARDRRQRADPVRRCFFWGSTWARWTTSGR